MEVVHCTEVERQRIEMEGAVGVSKQVLVGPAQKAPNFVMRLFELAPGGRTPNHVHDWEHEVFVLEGSGVAERPDGESGISSGSVVYVAPGDRHGFVNTGDSPLRFICVIPAMD